MFLFKPALCIHTLPQDNPEDSHRNDLRNDETIISSISITDIVFDVYLGKWSYRAIPKMKTWSYFLTIPKHLAGSMTATFPQ